MQKFSSNVVEKCLKLSGVVREGGARGVGGATLAQVPLSSPPYHALVLGTPFSALGVGPPLSAQPHLIIPSPPPPPRMLSERR